MRLFREQVLHFVQDDRSLGRAGLRGEDLCRGAGAAEDQEAVEAPLGVFYAVGGEVGEPLVVGEVAELVEALGEGELGAPPAVAEVLHGGLAFAPGVESSDDADGLDVAAEEAELDLA